MDETGKHRPYWHVDAKWLGAVVLVVVLGLTLPVAALYRLTARPTATTLLAYVVASLASPDGLDSETGLADLRDRVHRNGSEVITVGGVPTTVTAADVDHLSPRELRLKAFSGFAAAFYDNGPVGLASGQGSDPAVAKKGIADAAPLRPLTREGHDWLGRVLLILAGVDLLLLGVVVGFSRRLGRLVSPGVVLCLVGLPGPLFWAISTQPAKPAAHVDSVAAGIGALAGQLTPLVAGPFAQVYLAALLLGLVLLVFAGLAALVRRVRRPAATDPVPPAEEYAEEPVDAMGTAGR